MEIIFWLVALYFIGKHWLKKHPNKAAMLKKSWAQKPAATTTAAKPHKQMASPNAHSILKVSKKTEKQFHEL